MKKANRSSKKGKKYFSFNDYSECQNVSKNLLIKAVSALSFLQSYNLHHVSENKNKNRCRIFSEKRPLIQYAFESEISFEAFSAR